MSLATPIDPALREVLEDVAKQAKPGSLFRGLGPDRIGGAFTLPDQQVSVATAGLTVAERELVRSHREELASVLRGAFLRSHFNPQGHLAPVRIDFEPESYQSLASRARRLIGADAEVAYRHRTGHYLLRVTREESVDQFDDQASLLVASLRLQDKWSARHYYAMLQYRHGHFKEAMREVGAIMDTADPLPASYAYSLRRSIRTRNGDPVGAVNDGWAASRLACDSGSVTFGMMEMAGVVLSSLFRGWTIRRKEVSQFYDPDQVRAIALDLVSSYKWPGKGDGGQGRRLVESLDGALG